MKATNSTGNLNFLTDLQGSRECYIRAKIGDQTKEVVMYILPDISDSKQASYADETGIGRSAPLKIFSHSETRTISWTAHFHSATKKMSGQNMENLRIIEALVYPDDARTLAGPPPIARIKCGNLLGVTELCAVLKSYTVKFPTDVAWDPDTFLPIKFDVDMSFEVVYETISLPGATKILNFGG